MGFTSKSLVLVLIAHVCSATIRAGEEVNAKAIDEYIESKIGVLFVKGAIEIAMISVCFGSGIRDETVVYSINLLSP